MLATYTGYVSSTSYLVFNKEKRAGQLCLSEVMTILIHFHQSHYRTFKAYYTQHMQMHLTSEFPHLVSYTRFVALIPRMMLPLLVYAERADMGSVPGSASLIRPQWQVCDPKRIDQHRVFAVDAKRSKTGMGWFFGFKLHLAVQLASYSREAS